MCNLNGQSRLLFSNSGSRGTSDHSRGRECNSRGVGSSCTAGKGSNLRRSQSAGKDRGRDRNNLSGHRATCRAIGDRGRTRGYRVDICRVDSRGHLLDGWNREVAQGVRPNTGAAGERAGDDLAAAVDGSNTRSGGDGTSSRARKDGGWEGGSLNTSSRSCAAEGDYGKAGWANSTANRWQ